ncbi:helix-turn-helix transcriptional regulator [Streptomyces sp. NPDC048644]|uniref:helix-turn-helix transcriptional regulator n=1 Tax=Streptomyces sp. NPDC048644 TaxID=3365582 RepID=UPI00371F5FC9
MDDGIGPLLVRLREPRGWTQQDVADKCNDLEGSAAKTGKEIGRYEREKRLPTPYTRTCLAAVFGVDRSLLDRATAVSKQRRHSAVDAKPGMSGSAHGPSETVESAAASLAADAASSSAFIRFIAATNTDITAVEGLHADVARLARHYVSHPLSELHAEIRDLRETAFGLLKGRQRPSQTVELYVIAGRLCGISAHVCLDAGDYDSAAAQARAAWACADVAQHNGMRAWVRAADSLIAFWAGDTLRAAQLARAGQQFVAFGSIGARLASLEARALAAGRDQRGAVRALARAERLREKMNGEDEVPGIFSFPVAKQAAYAGTTHLALGGEIHVQQAIMSAETAVRLYRGAENDDRSVGDLFAAHVDLARGHMMAGDVDGTEAMLGYVLNARPETRSASIARRLGDLGEELSARAYRGSPQVANLRERLQEAAVRNPLPNTSRRHVT